MLFYIQREREREREREGRERERVHLVNYVGYRLC